MKHLVIIGAGGYGREMYGAALGSVGYGTEFDVKGYLDGNADGFLVIELPLLLDIRL